MTNNVKHSPPNKNTDTAPPKNPTQSIGSASEHIKPPPNLCTSNPPTPQPQHAATLTQTSFRTNNQAHLPKPDKHTHTPTITGPEKQSTQQSIPPNVRLQNPPRRGSDTTPPTHHKNASRGRFRPREKQGNRLSTEEKRRGRRKQT